MVPNPEIVPSVSATGGPWPDLHAVRMSMIDACEGSSVEHDEV